MNNIIHSSAKALRYVTFAAVVSSFALVASPITVRANDDVAAPTVPKCKKGKVFNPRIGKCVRKRSDLINDQDKYLTGVQLARAGQFDEAIDILSSVANKNDPRVLTYIGFSHRKMGNMVQGEGFYKKALKIDPDYVLARGYLGQGYVAEGKIVLAFLQLKEIENRCGTSCAPYSDLKRAISTSRTIY